MTQPSTPPQQTSLRDVSSQSSLSRIDARKLGRKSGSASEPPEKPGSASAEPPRKRQRKFTDGILQDFTCSSSPEEEIPGKIASRIEQSASLGLAAGGIFADERNDTWGDQRWFNFEKPIRTERAETGSLKKRVTKLETKAAKTESRLQNQINELRDAVGPTHGAKFRRALEHVVEPGTLPAWVALANVQAGLEFNFFPGTHPGDAAILQRIRMFTQALVAEDADERDLAIRLGMPSVENYAQLLSAVETQYQKTS
ncbi:hypothetical protein LTR49_028118 [Elasticomyces elasticus]|nr:hypothetical protein LTR49_028118 [Elasticomyces elasticus]